MPGPCARHGGNIICVWNFGVFQERRRLCYKSPTIARKYSREGKTHSCRCITINTYTYSSIAQSDPRNHIITMPAAAEVQAATLERFIKGWSGWTPDGFLSTWSNDCTQKTLPFSSEVPIRTRADTEHLFPILMSLMTNFQVSAYKGAVLRSKQILS